MNHFRIDSGPLSEVTSFLEPEDMFNLAISSRGFSETIWRGPFWGNGKETFSFDFDGKQHILDNFMRCTICERVSERKLSKLGVPGWLSNMCVECLASHISCCVS